jgi:ABC-type lipoprotein release transport system permease subunit
MMIFKLALKNLLGAGMRTWLNVIVLSISFVIIIFYNGMIDGWNQQARKDTIQWEIGKGQLWHSGYDPFDPFTLQDAHGPLPAGYDAAQWVPELIVQASVYPQGRMQSAMLRGIPAGQLVLALPTGVLAGNADETSALIGKNMAKAMNLNTGDRVLIRWRDKHGMFDAKEVRIAAVFDCDVPTVDNGQIWLDIEQLRQMTGMENEATLFVSTEASEAPSLGGWQFKDHDFLLADLDAIIQSKKGGAAVIYLLLLAIALLAIFDTQVLSIFRRQKEIGTYIALGMTRQQVVGLFTLEGGATSILAAGIGAIYGAPLFVYFAKTGFGMPATTANSGIAIAERIFPVYGLGLILGTMLLIVISATIVSYLPARKIAKMNPTAALKGKLQ